MAPYDTRRDAVAFIDGKRQPLEGLDLDRTVAAVTEMLPVTRKLSSFERAAILDRTAAALAADAETLITALTEESGYLTRRDMTLEVQRVVEIFTMCAALARTGLEETFNVDAVERARDTIGFVRREPIGPILGITAFNAPFLITAHKLAPAIVAGAPIIIKPAPRVPNASILLGEYVTRAGWPTAALTILPVDNDDTMRLITDPRLPLVSFTGGAFGWKIKDAVPRKHVHLELGGVGAVIIAADADLEQAATECTTGAFVRSGQACISVQRIYVEKPAYDRFTKLLAARVKKLVTGDPGDTHTDVGPLVDETAAKRIETMIADAVDKGARTLTGGLRDGNVVQPTLLADVTPEMSVTRAEAFGPLVSVAPVNTLAEAVAETNAVPGAIHVGVYTRNMDTALTIADQVRGAGVIINGPSTWRVDHMPYGGVGTSGFGREGVKAMVEEFTEAKVIIIRHKPRSLG